MLSKKYCLITILWISAAAPMQLALREPYCRASTNHRITPRRLENVRNCSTTVDTTVQNPFKTLEEHANNYCRDYQEFVNQREQIYHQVYKEVENSTYPSAFQDALCSLLAESDIAFDLANKTFRKPEFDPSDIYDSKEISEVDKELDKERRELKNPYRAWYDTIVKASCDALAPQAEEIASEVANKAGFDAACTAAEDFTRKNYSRGLLWDRIFSKPYIRIGLKNVVPKKS